MKQDILEEDKITKQNSNRPSLQTILFELCQVLQQDFLEKAKL